MTDDRRSARSWLIAYSRPMVAVSVLIGCSQPGAGTSSDDGAWIDAIELDTCGFAELAAVTVDISERADIFHSTVFSRITGLVQDGPDPSFHRVFEEEGSCRYLKTAYGNCEPACGQGEVCTFADECIAYPTTVSGGTLTIRGLDSAVAIEPEDWSAGTYTGPAGLPSDLFSAGDPLGAELAGDVFPALSIGAEGVAVMDRNLGETGFTMEDGQDAELTWTGESDSKACVQLKLFSYNAAHGAPLPDIIWCEGPDTGSMAVPRSFVEAFPRGMTPEVTSGYDWPHSELTRYTSSTRSTEFGPARIVARSTTYFLLNHPE